MSRRGLILGLAGVLGALGVQAACSSFGGTDATPAGDAGTSDATSGANDGGPTSTAVVVSSATPPNADETGGTQVVIHGAGFATGAVVSFAGVVANVSSVTASSITVTTPKSPGLRGYVPVKVQNPGGDSATGAKVFRYTSKSATLTPVASAVPLMPGALPGRIVLATADLRGTKKRDVLAGVAASSSAVLALLANGDGTFQAAAAFGAGNGAYALGPGDINDDGKDDVVFVNSAQDTVNIALADGNGGLLPAYFLFNNAGHPLYKFRGVLTSNFYGVKKHDPVLLLDNLIIAPPGLGDGGFPASFITTGAPTLTPFTELAAGDLNGDGITDLSITIEDPAKPGVFIGRGHDNGGGHGDGSFGATLISPVFVPLGVVMADFDGDGHVDVATLETPNMALGQGQLVVLYHGKGDGTVAIDPTAMPPQPRRIDTGFGSVSDANLALGAGDVNGDTTPDIVVAGVNGHLSVLLNDGTGTFTRVPLMDLTLAWAGAITSPRALLVEDLDGDGRVDVCIAGVGTNTAIGVMLAK